MTIEAITFDLWNTLVHNRNYGEFRLPALDRILRSNGITLSEEKLQEAYMSGFRYSSRVIPAEGYRHVETHEIVDKVLETVGFSSPDRNIDLDIIAVALVVDVIEKRITLSRKLKGHHHVLCLEPDEIPIWNERIRFTEEVLGSNEIQPSKIDLSDSKKYFRNGLKRILNIRKDDTTYDTKINNFYEDVRCSLFHDGMTRKNIGINGSVKESIIFESSITIINPYLLFKEFTLYFENYIDIIKNNKDKVLVSNFKKYWHEEYT